MHPAAAMMRQSMSKSTQQAISQNKKELEKHPRLGFEV
jgi:hypothetical protein